MSSFPSVLAAAVIMGAVCAGCTVYSDPYPVGYAELHYGTAYGYYPHAWYDGRDVYYIDNRWMYRDSVGWRYYRYEPPPLYQYRSTVRQAPPAYYGYPRGGYPGGGYPGGGYAPAPRAPSYGAPPAYRAPPARGAAPSPPPPPPPAAPPRGAPPPTRVR